MLQRDTLNLITRFVVIGSALLVAIAFLVGGPQMGVGAIAGGAFAVVNWLAMRWLGQRLMVANPRGRTFLGILLAAKMFVSLGVVALILATRLIDPIGFVIGFSGLIVGIVAGVFLAAAGAGSAPDSKGTPASSEEG